jgi:hypothetical protein
MGLAEYFRNLIAGSAVITAGNNRPDWTAARLGLAA